MPNIKSFPNNQDTYTGAEFVMKWLHGRTSGVFAAGSNAAVAAVPDRMAVTVSDGYGWIANENLDGVSWWIDAEKQTGIKLTLEVEMAESALARIDRVILNWQTTNYVALPTVSILKGTPSSAPIPPALINNATQRQISFAQVRIPAGVTAITASMITDERLNPEVCGIVTESVEADTAVVNAQFLELLEHLRKNIEQVASGGIADGAITAPKLANDAVTARAIKNLSITAPKYADKSIGTRAIADQAIGEEQIYKPFLEQLKGIKVIKEWENASPTSDFPAQTITLKETMQDNDLLMVLDMNRMAYFVSKNLTKGMILDVGFANLNVRNFALISPNSLKFETGLTGNYNSLGAQASETAAVAKPAEIYLIKGVK